MNNKNIDMTEGPIFTKLVAFTFPLMITAILQMLYSAADMLILGIFVGSDAVGAVGATTSINHLIINLFLGLSAGTTVTVAQAVGAKKYNDVKETVSTSIYCAIIFGVLVTIIGMFISRPALTAMNTPKSLIEDSILYMRVVFIGMTPNLIYSYGSAVMRANSDSKKPLIILSVSGIINVALNFVLVVVFKLSVAGVAVSTAVSQLISAIMVLTYLYKSTDYTHFDFKHLKFYFDKFIKIIKVGIPSGIQGCIFSITNVLIQSSINSFGEAAVSGNASAVNIDDLLTTTLSSMYHTVLTFVSQNVGAKKFDRIKKIVLYSLLLTAATGTALGICAYIFKDPLLSIFIKNNPEAMYYGQKRILYVGLFAVIGGLMDMTSGCLRGIGASLQSMIGHLLGICVYRIIWRYTVFAALNTIDAIYISYPISWTITFIGEFICFIILKNKLIKNVNSIEKKDLHD